MIILGHSFLKYEFKRIEFLLFFQKREHQKQKSTSSSSSSTPTKIVGRAQFQSWEMCTTCVLFVVRPVRVTVQKQFRINLTALVLNNVTLIHKIPTVVTEEF